MTIIEKIIALHSNQEKVKPGDIVDVQDRHPCRP